jgi:exosortase/archaeosortase family protein
MSYESDPAPRDRRTAAVIGLAWPIGLLLLEATALTPFVEFSKGGMAFLASPHLLTAGIVAISTFVLIVAAMKFQSPQSEAAIAEAVSESNVLAGRPAGWKTLLRPWAGVRLAWLGAHAMILTAFVCMTLTLHARSSTVGVSWALSFVWLLAAASVAASILLAFIPLRGLISLAHRYTWQACVASAIGAALILMTPAIRGFWPDVDRPALRGLNVLLNMYPGQAISSQGSHRWPIIGTPRMALLVTPACSELDSLLIFVLLAGTLWAAMGARLSAWKYLLLLLAGLAVLYALLCLRLYFMILIGLWSHDAYVAVKFAHSRISTLVFLLYTVGILSLASKVARPTIAPRIRESLSEEESLPEIVEPEPVGADRIETALDA